MISVSTYVKLSAHEMKLVHYFVLCIALFTLCYASKDSRGHGEHGYGALRTNRHARTMQGQIQKAPTQGEEEQFNGGKSPPMQPVAMLKQLLSEAKPSGENVKEKVVRNDGTNVVSRPEKTLPKHPKMKNHDNIKEVHNSNKKVKIEEEIQTVQKLSSTFSQSNFQTEKTEETKQKLNHPKLLVTKLLNSTQHSSESSGSSYLKQSSADLKQSSAEPPHIVEANIPEKETKNEPLKGAEPIKTENKTNITMQILTSGSNQNAVKLLQVEKEAKSEKGNDEPLVTSASTQQNSEFPDDSAPKFLVSDNFTMVNYAINLEIENDALIKLKTEDHIENVGSKISSQLENKEQITSSNEEMEENIKPQSGELKISEEEIEQTGHTPMWIATLSLTVICIAALATIIGMYLGKLNYGKPHPGGPILTEEMEDDLAIFNRASYNSISPAPYDSWRNEWY